jgi:1,2-dihydroxy-3-keto-5-methylthiopentene dioxygenase
MSRLRIFAADDGAAPYYESLNPAAISEQLSSIGVQFERWAAPLELAPGVAPEVVLEAYREPIARFMHAGGFQAVDVVSLHPEHPQKAELRQKFLNEHTHAEDEIRFFVAGSGLFTIHDEARGKVYETLCQQHDLIRLPAGTKHWFDMGPEPFFVAIRIFNNPAGWVAQFTGQDIAARFPRFETAVV